MEKTKELSLVRMRLVETGGRSSQELGLGRIVGQVLVYLYLRPTACCLEELEEELGLSKASVSIAARQLETFGLVNRVWVKGERKRYYRSADNIASALQQGLISQVHQRTSKFGEELDACLKLLDNVSVRENHEELKFLMQRVGRAKKLQSRLSKVLGQPLLRLFSKTVKK